MELEAIIPSEISQAQKNKDRMFPLMDRKEVILKSRQVVPRDWNGCCREGRRVEEGGPGLVSSTYMTALIRLEL
ncbi:hypothetical protein H671_6g16735 [Cricetulus griseus]|nr:hypothetical protein H671_6g16735 [Cricetulus griseus]